MGYGYTCNECEDEHPDADPALMCQLHERWFMTSAEGGMLSEMGLSHEETITICPDCALDILL